MNQRGFALAPLLFKLWPYIGIALLSAGLYWQIGRTAQEKEAHRATIAINQSMSEAIERQKRESQLTEVLLVEHAGKRETIVEEKEKVVVRLKEVIRNAPANDCLVTEHPADINGLLNSHNEN